MTYKPNNRMTPYFTAIVLVVSLGTISSGLEAQELEEPKPRQGYYLSLGTYGIVSTNYNSNNDEWLGAWPGGQGSLRVGEKLFDWMDLGISVKMGANTGSDYWSLVGHFSVETQIRPIVCNDAFFLRASAGFGFADVSRRKQDLEKIVGQVGGAYSVSVGYDFFPTYKNGSGGFALTPVVGLEVGTGDMLTSMMGFIGLEFSFWTGLPPDKLDIPI